MENDIFSSSLPIGYRGAMTVDSHGFPSSLLHPDELDNTSQRGAAIANLPFFMPFQEEDAMENLHLTGHGASFQGLLSGNPNLQENFIGSAIPAASVLSSEDMGTFISHHSSSNSTSVTCPYGVEQMKLGFAGSYGDFLSQQVLPRPSCHILPGSYGMVNNELSLSLGSSRSAMINVHDRISEDCSRIIPGSRREARNDHPGNPNAGRPSDSRYTVAMEQILAEVASYALENLSELEDSVSSSCSSERGDVSPHGGAEKSELIAMLETVDEGYNRCLIQMQSAVAKFHASANSDVGQTAAHLAMRAISRAHRSLRERIATQILAAGNLPGGGQPPAPEERSFASPQLKRNEQQTWRPQRGLPERSVSVLRAWMFQNFLHPYPKDSDKHLLAIKSGLTRSQVSNWFINARVRLWKPMIEEMHSEVCKKEQGQELAGDIRGRLRVG